MQSAMLGKTYQTGETIMRQGQPIDCMYVVQQGQVEVIHERDGQEVRLSILGEGDFFGEIPFFQRVSEPGVGRATVRALEEVSIITVDKRTILRRLHEDPSLSYRIMQVMSRRVQQLETEIIRLLVGPKTATEIEA